MPPDKPKTISSDGVPDQIIDRGMLGKGSIVNQLIILNGNPNDSTLDYIDIPFLNLSSTESQVQSPMSLNGRFKKFKYTIWQNGISADLVLTLRKNGIDTNDIITIHMSDSGLFSHDLSTEFIEDDLINWKIQGNNAGSSVQFNGFIEIEYDG